MELDHTERSIHQGLAAKPGIKLPEAARGGLPRLLVIAVLADLFTPILIWKGILPDPTRWASHAAVAAMILMALALMFQSDQFPTAAVVVAGLSTIGASVAFFEGQGIGATLWGWWMMFQFPMVGLFAYLYPHWPARLPQRFLQICVAILAIQVVVQVGQYLTGEMPGDNLAGTLGEHGTGKLIVFIMFVLCLALGRWLAQGEGKTLLVVLSMGLISSALGEMKLFLFALFALGLLTLIILAFREASLLRVVSFAVLLVVVLTGYFSVYDSVVPRASHRPLATYLDIGVLERYLGFGAPFRTDAGSHTGRFNLGRNYEVLYGWNELKRDPTTFLLGYGLGARGESQALGIAGMALLRGNLGLTTGRSLLVMMQELGMLGMITLGVFLLWVVVRLSRAIRRDPSSDDAEIQYGLLLFSLLWPLWLWYAEVWGSFRFLMLLYWASLGYAMARITKSPVRIHRSPPSGALRRPPPEDHYGH